MVLLRVVNLAGKFDSERVCEEDSNERPALELYLLLDKQFK
jgi:hypothetical protein